MFLGAMVMCNASTRPFYRNVWEHESALSCPTLSIILNFAHYSGLHRLLLFFCRSALSRS